MDFVTIHDLSRELNTPARVIRYRLIHLIMEGKLKENDDFRRDDFKDDQHFIWKINPLSFMRATELKPAAPVNHIDNSLVTAVPKTDSQPIPSVNQQEKNDATAGVGTLPRVNHTGNNQATGVNETGNKVDTKEPSLEREMIDLLKEQIKVKDGQLHEQGEQLKDLNDLNVKLTGTMLQQNQKIENLLRITGGKSEESGREAGMDNPRPATDDLAQAA